MALHERKIIKLVSGARDLRALPLAALHAVMAIRLCVISHHVDRDPAGDLIERFGNMQAAKKFLVLYEVIGNAWPDPFIVSRPCCYNMSFDECLFADIVIAGNANNRPTFDSLTHEMLNSDARNTVFAALTAFQRAYLKLS